MPRIARGTIRVVSEREPCGRFGRDPTHLSTHLQWRMLYASCIEISVNSKRASICFIWSGSTFKVLDRSLLEEAITSSSTPHSSNQIWTSFGPSWLLIWKLEFLIKDLENSGTCTPQDIRNPCICHKIWTPFWYFHSEYPASFICAIFAKRVSNQLPFPMLYSEARIVYCLSFIRPPWYSSCRDPGSQHVCWKSPPPMHTILTPNVHGGMEVSDENGTSSEQVRWSARTTSTSRQSHASLRECSTTRTHN